MDLEYFVAKICEKSTYILVTKHGETKRYEKAYLAKCFLTMSNDAFYNMLGFNWVPTEYWKSVAIMQYNLK